MIHVNRLRQQKSILLNPDLFQRIEPHVDTTVITMQDGTEYVVGNTVDEIVERIVEYRARVIAVAGLIQARDYGDEPSDVHDAGDAGAPLAELTSESQQSPLTEEQQ